METLLADTGKSSWLGAAPESSASGPEVRGAVGVVSQGFQAGDGDMDAWS